MDSFLVQDVIGQAQKQPTVTTGNFDTKKQNWDTQITITDVMGRPFVPYYREIEGTPFLFQEWKKAKAILANGLAMEDAFVNLDLYKQEIHFLNQRKEEIILNPGVIKELQFVDSSGGDATLKTLRMGYPPVDNQKNGNFYLVVADGKMQVLKFSYKQIVELKNEMSGEIRKEFKSNDTYYVYVNDKIFPLKKDKNFFLNNMSDKLDQVQKYITEKNVNFRNQHQIIALVNYYNSL